MLTTERIGSHAVRPLRDLQQRSLWGRIRIQNAGANPIVLAGGGTFDQCLVFAHRHLIYTVAAVLRPSILSGLAGPRLRWPTIPTAPRRRTDQKVGFRRSRRP